jgi:hypothetical protein
MTFLPKSYQAFNQILFILTFAKVLIFQLLPLKKYELL